MTLKIDPNAGFGRESDPIPTQIRIELRNLVDRVWNEAKQSQEVTETRHCDQIIDAWYAAHPRLHSETITDTEKLRRWQLDVLAIMTHHILPEAFKADVLALRGQNNPARIDIEADFWVALRAAVVAAPRFREMYAAGGMLNDGIANTIAWLAEPLPAVETNCEPGSRRNELDRQSAAGQVRTGSLCAICDHLEELHGPFNLQHPFTPKPGQKTEGSKS